MIDQLTPCVSSASADQPLQSGTGDIVDGFARTPVQRTALFVGLAGPRSSLVWPLVGGLPGVPLGDGGEFLGIRGLSGGWIEPPMLHKEVSVGSSTARASVDLALPALTDPPHLAWNSALPLRPALRLTDVDAMAAWQQGLVAAGIGRMLRSSPHANRL